MYRESHKNMETARECGYFKSAFDSATHPIILKSNPKYGDKLHGMLPYICYDDVMDYNCVIKAYPKDGVPSFSSTDGEVVCKYDSIEDMVGDGWRID